MKGDPVFRKRHARQILDGARKIAVMAFHRAEGRAGRSELELERMRGKIEGLEAAAKLLGLDRE